ncbi:dnaJ homolog subfamily C member 2-like [Lytechinus variegatus]|uniref:dnaJ homolog subfamily C member 2-like n=1 Tax=Lytechinus variegatus TaxID=7654 RepID=UPI001BB2044E|nr:dnaJ homolog subfamily C member 2-like [Lytechinus variegatus]
MVLLLLPPAISDADETEIQGTLTAPTSVQIEPVGRWFEVRLHRQRNHLSASYTESLPSDDDEEDSGEEDIFDEDEDDSMLQTLDPKEWKDHDHYKILGLSKLRYKASQHDIRRAHKRKVLKHHPDKREDRKTRVRKSGDDDYFSCITKAYEVLGNPVKRRAYDSVDPEFDNDVPSNNQQSKDKFFATFSDVFKRNARWSIKKPVPDLGNDKSTFKEVNNFYNFWYDFQSWREFSYLDEEEKEKGECREERRWIDKQNRAERQRRKKEENARMRTLIDNAYACDPRIKRFKDEEKERKAREKRAKQEAVKAAALEKEKERLAVLEAERLAKEKEEEEAKAKAQAAKKEKEALKKAMRKERKALRETCKKHGYFTNEDGLVKAMEDMEKLCERLSLVRLQEVNERFSGADQDKSKAIFQEEVAALTAEIEREHQEELRKQQELLSSSKGGDGGGAKGGKAWSEADTALLIKAANIFPPGTSSRYEVIANYINNHSTSGINRVAKDIISKTKNLQRLDGGMKQAANEKAFEKFQQATGNKMKKSDEAQPSEKFEAGDGAGAEGPKPWTTDEQKRLEQALKTFPASATDRWDKIAEAVPTRTKKECMKRYKELVEMVKAKKAAQAQVAKSKKP